VNTRSRSTIPVLFALLAAACAPACRVHSGPDGRRIQRAVPSWETLRDTVSEQSRRRPVSTYSIVARDGATGRFGVAVQSHWFSVGSVVPWAEAGVGAIATQSLVEVSYGPAGLDLLRAGKSAEEALAALTSVDQGAQYRQVAIVDREGGVAVHTGELCIAHAGHHTATLDDGTSYSVQANLMGRPTVPEAMAAAFEEAKGPLADRLLQALEAAEAEGGDIRGRQSAAVTVVEAQSTGRPWTDTVVDLRIEDHPEPIKELRRLYRLHRAYERMNAGDVAMEHGDVEQALVEYGAALQLVPGHPEMAFWTGVSLAGAGRIDDALPYFATAFADREGDWREVVQRLPASDLLPADEDMIEKILSVQPDVTPAGAAPNQ